MTERTIYLLKDPRDESARYVGITVNLERRIKLHLSTSENNRKSAWIKSLKKIGLIPLIEILEIIKDDNWQDHERLWIIVFIMFGARLVNSHIGGCGTAFGNKIGLGNKSHLGKTHSIETRIKMSMTRKGKKFTKEHRINLGLAQVGTRGKTLGYKHTEEFKDKIRTRMIGNKIWVNRKHSEETKNKMRLAWEKRRLKDKEN